MFLAPWTVLLTSRWDPVPLRSPRTVIFTTGLDMQETFPQNRRGKRGQRTDMLPR